jgi:hypothetical protein
MAIDLTPTADGTLRLLGNKQYIYKSAANRWERVILVVPNATITSDYDGKSDGAQVYAGQQVRMSVKWNQNVSSSLFNQSMLTTTGITPTIQNFAQDSVDASLYTFNFSFTGPLGQITIPANSVSVFTNTNNSVIFSEAVPGAYLPYAIMSIEPKSITYNNVLTTIFSFIDPNFKNVLRYFTASQVYTSSSTNDTNSSQYINSRIKVSFINTSNVSTSGPTGFTYTDIVRKTGPYFTTPPLTGSVLYSSNSNFISATSANTSRYQEMYYTSVPTDNYIGSYSIAAGAYLDNNQNNIAISPIYFGRFSSGYFNVAIQFVRTSGTSNGVIKVYLNHFASFVSNLDQSKITLSASTANGTSLTPLTLLKDTTVDANAIYGNMYTANYTVPPGTTDVTDVITLDSGTFTIPAANASNINGISYYSVNPPDSPRPWSSQKTSISNFINIISPRSPVKITAGGPANNETGVTGVFDSNPLNNSLIYYVSGAPRTVSSNNSLGDFPFKLYADAGKTTLLSQSFVQPSGTSMIAHVPRLFSNTTYYTFFPQNAYKDDYGNYSSESFFIFTTADLGPLLLTANTPSNGGIFYSNTDITIDTSRPISTTNTSLNWVLSNTGGTVIATNTVPIFTGNTTNILYKDFAGKLYANTTYNVIIPSDAYTDVYNVKSSAYANTFTTIDPGPLLLTANTPSNGGIFYGNTNITIDISRSSYSTNTNLKWTLSNTEGYVVATSNVTPDVNKIITIPLSSFSSNIRLSNTYNITIPANAYIDNLNVKTNAYSNSFTITSVPISNDYVFAPYSGYNSQVYSSTVFTVPSFITSISAVAIAPGGTGLWNTEDYGDAGTAVESTNGGAAGGGGGLGYVNNISVSPGENLILEINANTISGNIYTQITRNSDKTVLLQVERGQDAIRTSPYTQSEGGAGGRVLIGLGGAGGRGGNNFSGISTGGAGSGAAGTYYGAGGNGGDGASSGTNIGTTGANNNIGGTGTHGASGSSGTGANLYGPSTPAPYGVAGNWGAGGSGSGGGQYKGVETNAAIRILWGDGRAFPNTNISTSSS